MLSRLGWMEGELLRWNWMERGPSSFKGHRKWCDGCGGRVVDGCGGRVIQLDRGEVAQWDERFRVAQNAAC